MAERTFRVIEYYPAAGVKTCPFCEVENPAGNTDCYICKTNLSIPYIENDVVEKDLRKGSKKDTGTDFGSSSGFGVLPPISSPETPASSPWPKILIAVGAAIAIISIIAASA